jgi:hypothetical protein
VKRHHASLSFVVGSDPREFCLSCEHCDLYVGPTTDRAALEARQREHEATAKRGEHVTEVKPSEGSEQYWLTCNGCDLKVGPSAEYASLREMGRKHEAYVQTRAIHYP